MTAKMYETNSPRFLTFQKGRSVPMLIRVGEKEKRLEHDREYGVFMQAKLQININNRI